MLIGWLFLHVLIAPGCIPAGTPDAQVRAQTQAPSAQPTVLELAATRLPGITPTRMPTTSLPATVSQPTCPDGSGTIEQSTLRDPRLFRELPFRVYLPPCYGEDPERRYPTLYLLHGLQSTDSQWDDLGIAEVADRLILSGTLPPFIIVMPWHRTGIDLTRAIPEVLLPHVEQNYAARPERTYRAIGGLSKGGGQALEIGLKYPQLFAALGMHSPAVQYLDRVVVEWALDIPAPTRPKLWLDIGMQDSLYPAAESLLTELQRNSIPITIQINEGDHLAKYWQTHLEGYLRWYGSNWQRESLKPTFEQ